MRTVITVVHPQSVEGKKGRGNTRPLQQEPQQCPGLPALLLCFCFGRGDGTSYHCVSPGNVWADPMGSGVCTQGINLHERFCFVETNIPSRREGNGRWKWEGRDGETLN